MKKIFLGLALASTVMAIGTARTVKADQTIYRLYNKNNGEHLYTVTKMKRIPYLLSTVGVTKGKLGMRLTLVKGHLYIACITQAYKTIFIPLMKTR